MKTAIVAGVISILGIGASVALPQEPVIPQCPEDAVLVGVGEFESGRWAAYECGPAVDDYSPFAGRRWETGRRWA